MKVEICLLDLDDEEIDGEISILLYGRSLDQKRVVVVDPSDEPYFYVLPENLVKAKREIESILRKKNINVKRIEETRKILRGQEREFIKVYCFYPRTLAK